MWILFIIYVKKIKNIIFLFKNINFLNDSSVGHSNDFYWMLKLSKFGLELHIGL